MLKDEAIVAALSSGASLAEAASQLVREANEAGGRDNITVVAFRLEEAGDPAADRRGATLIGPSAEGAGLSGERVACRRRAPSAERRASAAAAQPPLEDGRESAGRRAACRRRRRGAYFGARQVYFLGIDEGGRVALYRGLPYELPFGVEPLLGGLLGPGPGVLGPRGPSLERHRARAALARRRSVAARRPRRAAAEPPLRRQPPAAGQTRAASRRSARRGGGQGAARQPIERPQPGAARPGPGRAAAHRRLHRGLHHPVGRDRRSEPDLRRLLLRALPRRAPVPALPPSLRGSLPVPALRAAGRDRPGGDLPDRRPTRLRPGLGLRPRPGPVLR